MTYREQFETALREWPGKKRLRLLCLLQFGLTVEGRALVKELKHPELASALAVLNEIEHKVAGQVLAYLDGTPRYDAHQFCELLYGMASTALCEEAWERALLWALRRMRES